MARVPETAPTPLAPDRVDYLPMIDRPIIKWPNNARVAFWVAPNIEHYEYLPPLDGVRNPWPRTPLPDARQNSLHEYGNRVGVWRLLEVLDEYRIRCSTTLNIGVLEHFPDIAEAMLKRDWTFVNHGFYNTRCIITKATITRRSASASSTSSIGKARRAAGSCASPSIRTSWAVPTARNTWQ